MELDLSAGSLIRSGSGILFVLLGVALLATKRRADPRVASLALFAIPFGASFVFSNVFRNVLSVVVAAQTSWYLATIVALPFVLRTMPRRPVAVWTLLAGGAFVALFLAWELPGYNTFAQSLGLDMAVPRMRALIIANVVAIGAWLALPPLFAFAAWGAPEPERRRLALISSSFVLYLGAAASSDLLAPLSATTAFTDPRFAMGVVACTGLAWLAILAKYGGASARNAALLPFAALLYGMLPFLVSPTAFEDWGFIGIARVLSWSILVYAIVRIDILDLGLAQRSVDRSALAAGALAALFIAAQIAQNFFSAQFGLLIGGAVAGAFLFAAQPLQRALEGRGETRAGAGKNDDAFRAAVRLAFKDRRFSHEEELALADLAERLGIGARRATEIRHEIEREPGRERGREA